MESYYVERCWKVPCETCDNFDTCPDCEMSDEAIEERLEEKKQLKIEAEKEEKENQERELLERIEQEIKKQAKIKENRKFIGKKITSPEELYQCIEKRKVIWFESWQSTVNASFFVDQPFIRIMDLCEKGYFFKYKKTKKALG